MPYTHFQYIAYQTPTFGFDKVPFEPGELCDPVDDIPVPENQGLYDDALRRLRRFAAVMDLAYREAGARGNNILKVFVAPEFYFRPKRGDNFHTYPQAQHAIIHKILGRMFANTKFRDWLIVPGTILANVVPPSGRWAFYNTAVVIKGGRRGLLSSIEKQQPSKIDGVPVIGGIANPDIARGEYVNYYKHWSVRKKRVFMSDGIQFGLDICLDHNGPTGYGDPFRVAKHVASRVHYEAHTDISLHILTAGGMPIVDQSVAAKIGGYILRTDGSPGKLPYTESNTELKRVEGYTWTTPNGVFDTTPYNMEIGASATLADTSRPDTIELTGALKIPTPGVPMTQEIVIYPVTRLP